MNVLYDHQIFSTQNFGGVSRYFTEIITGLGENNVNAIPAFYFSNNIYLSSPPFEYKNFLSNFYIPKKQQIIYGINKRYAIQKLTQQNYDIFHPTNYDDYFLDYIGSKPFVITLHDMIHEMESHKYEELLQDKATIKRKEILLKKATKIIAVSENTKKDALKCLDISEDKITVIYHGNSFFKSENQGELFLKNQINYVLYVGSRKHYKNFIFLIGSLAQTLIDNNINLICAGGGDFSIEEKKNIQKFGLTQFVKQYSVNDRQLSNLYSNALFFVFPSTFEGFGIPILEAFACECPCLLSTCGALREVGGDAAIYFDPYDMESLIMGFNSLLSDIQLRRNLTISGLKRLKLFTWDNAVNQTQKVYESII